jgi:hypothetical protein
VLFGKILENIAYEYVTGHSCFAMLPSPHPVTTGTVHCAVCTVQCAVCSVQCALCTVHCAVCSVTDADADADADSAMESKKAQVTTSKEKELR